MIWFGPSWNAPINNPSHRVATPVGEICTHCNEAIDAEDRGVLIMRLDAASTMRPQHLECFLRLLVGSVGHQCGQCSCYGGSLEDPPGMTAREAARAAAELSGHSLL